ncbi:hypothetical protein ACI3K5_15390 [Streptomyces sp. MPA0124]|uniref:hypothetical protein n=1 Tax=unclassified Streptomyces TaxID=2593676 RepID=UPI00052A5A47|nr:hypothetical protein [Streptomyces sp. CCM_MD2014]AIV33887.1 hypothetical protein NI25_10585 [Streptomyces sp. CCM_MD2014]
MSVGPVRADAVRSDVSPGVLKVLDSGSSDHPPTALGGGRHGYTALRDTGVVPPCANKDASVVVSVAGDASHENGEESRAVAELATAVALEAAGRRSCETAFGGRIPELSLSKGQTAPAAASGTCEGIRIPEAQWVDWLQESEASDGAPLERCLLGETKARDEVLYSLEAQLGPYAQCLRSADHDEHWPEPGITHGSAQATASRPNSSVPAVFRIHRIHATVYAAPAEQFLRSALHTFAERLAVRHGFANLELPD